MKNTSNKSSVDYNYYIQLNKKYLLCTIFGGWFGLHKYLVKKKTVGILYTLTIGLFCFGWFYDIYIEYNKYENSKRLIDNKIVPTSDRVESAADIRLKTSHVIAAFATVSILALFIFLMNNHDSTMVWIPKTGDKYHSISNCSGMESPTHVPLDEAIDKGYEPCQDCYY